MKKEEIKYVFNIDALKPGDILILANCEDTKLIEEAGSKYIHAAIYMGDAQIIESDGIGVTMSHVFSYGFKEPDDAFILRYDKLTDSQIFLIIRKCREEMGKEWGGLQVARVPRYKDTNNHEDGNKTFCSRLVAEAYDSVGIRLVTNPTFCSPEDILQSPMLKHVDNPLVEANDTYKYMVERYQKIRKDGEGVESLATLYKSLSDYYNKDLQTFSQVIQASIDNPFKDDDACNIIKESDYFKNAGNNGYPWLDKDEDFFAHFPEVERQLFFISNQYLHYTITYIPCCRDNLFCMEGLEKMFPKSKVIKLFDCIFLRVMESNINLLKRIAQLYFHIQKRSPKEYKDFVDKYEIDFSEKLRPLTLL